MNNTKKISMIKYEIWQMTPSNVVVHQRSVRLNSIIALAFRERAQLRLSIINCGNKLIATGLCRVCVFEFGFIGLFLGQSNKNSAEILPPILRQIKIAG